MKVLLMVLSAVGLMSTACYSGPKLKNKMAYLDGDNYSESASNGAVPLYLKGKAKKTSLEGDVFSSGMTGGPLNGVSVVLLGKNQKVLKKVKTDKRGVYRFKDMLADGDYTLEFKYKNKIQKRMVPLKGYKAKVLRVYFD